MLTEEIIHKLLKHGVKDFQISLDGASAPINDYVRGNGVFDRVVTNIKILKKYNCHITLAMTVNSFNYNDILENSLNLVNKLGINKLMIDTIYPINKNEYFEPITNTEMIKLYNKLETNNKNRILIQLPKFDIRYGCGAGIYNCILNSDLTISPCDLLTHKYKSKRINNIDLFQKFWNEDEAFLKWRNELKCFTCKEKFKCLAFKEVKDD